MIFESAHYIALLIWVLGNALWAIGELYCGSRDEPHPLFSKLVDVLFTVTIFSSYPLFIIILRIHTLTDFIRFSYYLTL
jgi:hypothetical protein